MGLKKRIRMAAESILENESLREGLDDDAATALLEWGAAQAKQIAADTAELEDETEAEEAMYPRMRGLRKILVAVASLCAEEVEPARQAELIQEIAEHVMTVYNPTATDMSFDTNALVDFLATQPGNPVEIINGFRTLIEAKPNTE